MRSLIGVATLPFPPSLAVLSLDESRCFTYIPKATSATPVGGHLSETPHAETYGGFFMRRAAVMVDGGFLRVKVVQAGLKYNNDYIEKVVKASIAPDEELFRALYYDCAPFVGELTMPVSGAIVKHERSHSWVSDLASREYFAVRLGVLKFRGFRPKTVPITPNELDDEHFEPVFEQKGVDMRMGLDIATFSDTHAVERIILITNDTDCIPAMKFGRRAGIQIVLLGFPNKKPARDLLPHVDFYRALPKWPD